MGQTLPLSQRQRVAPQNVSKLMGIVGPTMAAAHLGVSTTLLHKAKKENSVNRVVETAATAVLDHLTDMTSEATPARAPKENDALFLIAVPREKADVVKQLAAALGAELIAA